MAKKAKKLKSGYTTGASAAAAVKGALFFLVHGEKKRVVTIPLLSQGSVDIAIFSLKKEDDRVICSVIKDAGDDPDITNRAEIGAAVGMRRSAGSRIAISGGRGVGTVTKPGLEVAPGAPAINPGPVKMIRKAVTDVINQFETKNLAVDIEIFVPKGEMLARKTLNDRLGIIGGISILGTTGVVKPLSHQAYIATIKSALCVAQAAGIKTLYFTTGRRSERYAETLFSRDSKEAFVQIGDYVGRSLEMASQLAFDKIVFVVFFGKAVKMAQGFYHTHAAKSSLSLAKLSDWSLRLTKDAKLAKEIENANTAREAFFILKAQHRVVIEFISQKILFSARNHASADIELNAFVLDYDGTVTAEAELDKKDISYE